MIKNKLFIYKRINDIEFERLTLVGGKTGVGKSWHIYEQILKAIKNNKSVVLFARYGLEDIVGDLLVVAGRAKEVGLDFKITEDDLYNANFTVIDTDEVDYISVVDMVEKECMEDGGPDLIVIDNLIMDSFDEFQTLYGSVVEYNLFDSFANSIGSEMLIATQIIR